MNIAKLLISYSPLPNTTQHPLWPISYVYYSVVVKFKLD